MRLRCTSAAYKGPGGNQVIGVVYGVDGLDGHIDAVFSGILWSKELSQLGGVDAFVRMQESILCDCSGGREGGSSRKRKFLGPTLAHQHRFVIYICTRYSIWLFRIATTALWMWAAVSFALCI